MSGRIDFTMDFNTHRASHKSDGGNHLRLYILGCFSGRSEVSWEQRKIRKIDIDNFDQVMDQIMPTLEISSGLTLKFETVDDFHPDAWFEKVQILADLQKLKKELSNPNTAAQAAMKIQAHFQPETKIDTPIQTQEAPESQDDILQRLLGKKPESTETKTNSVDQFIDQLISPFVIKETDLQHQALIKVIDSTMSQLLRTLLHRQDFQNLEALWRATTALVNEESGDEHSFFLVDISQAELLVELEKGSHSFDQKLLDHVQSDDDEQDILLIGDYCFSDSVDDRNLLKYCSQLAKACQGCFLGSADISLIENTIPGESKNAQHWSQFLNEISADKVILAYPRYLLRLPYGNKRDPIEALEFEECSTIPQSDELLWGSSAFVCARALIRTSQGRKHEDQYYFSDIPAFTFDLDGEQTLQLGTEALLNETQANTLLSQGITPLIGFRQRQGIRLMAITTLAEHS
jgi:type VI secretion system ImpB/VipA family protein